MKPLIRNRYVSFFRLVNNSKNMTNFTQTTEIFFSEMHFTMVPRQHRFETTWNSLFERFFKILRILKSFNFHHWQPYIIDVHVRFVRNDIKIILMRLTESFSYKIAFRPKLPKLWLKVWPQKFGDHVRSALGDLEKHLM